jgi:hypothetical protein
MSDSYGIQTQIDDEIFKKLFEHSVNKISQVPVSVQTRLTNFIGFESDILLANRLQTDLIGEGTFQGQTIKIGEAEYALKWASESQFRVPPIQIQTDPKISVDSVTTPRVTGFMAYEEPLNTENPLVELRNALLRCHREGISIQMVDETIALAVAQWVMEQ